jgi:hypothetical protein
MKCTQGVTFLAYSFPFLQQTQKQKNLRRKCIGLNKWVLSCSATFVQTSEHLASYTDVQRNLFSNTHKYTFDDNCVLIMPHWGTQHTWNR